MVFSKVSEICVIAAVILAVHCDAATYLEPAIMNLAYPGRCFDKITNRPLLPGKEYKAKGICAVMTCDPDAKVINIETCPDIEVVGCVELPPVDPRRSYPKCCPSFSCKDEKGNAMIIDMTS